MSIMTMLHMMGKRRKKMMMGQVRVTNQVSHLQCICFGSIPHEQIILLYRNPFYNDN